MAVDCQVVLEWAGMSAPEAADASVTWNFFVSLVNTGFQL